MNLRTARPDEADAIARLWQSGWHDGHAGHVPQALVGARTEESFRGRARSRLHEFTVAEVDGDVAGFIVVVEDELEQLYVSRNHRGQGVADTLLREAERVIRANGHSVGWLAVVEGMPAREASTRETAGTTRARSTMRLRVTPAR